MPADKILYLLAVFWVLFRLWRMLGPFIASLPDEDDDDPSSRQW